MKKIFDVIKDKNLIILYTQKQVADLSKLLNENGIRCKEECLETYIWVRIDKLSMLEFANFGPINQKCKAIKYEDLVNLLK